MTRPKTSIKASQFKESVIREMSRLAAKHEAVNLAQGFPDFPCPTELKEAAKAAIDKDINQYAITWGATPFRYAIAEKSSRYLGIPINPDTDITVTCGSTEAMAATMLALVDPGDEVIVFEPYYENYGPDAILAGAIPRYVQLKPPTWSFDPAELAAAFNEKTRAIIINTPHNPTGKVFSRKELQTITDLCQQWDVLAFTDEIYEHILYDGLEHLALASLPGMLERTVTINGLSKTYSVTGWRVGTIIAPAELTAAIRKVHDFLTVGAAAPLQQAGITAMQLPQTYYDGLLASYANKKASMLEILDEIGLPYYSPQGAYYVLCDISQLCKQYGFTNDVDFAQFMIETVGVAVVPGSSFLSEGSQQAPMIRFCFSKKPETLAAARERLLKLPELLSQRLRVAASV
ncbi:MAG: aminotransferase class I/II-fold pyridoxal phosphate-dependent enzyme [Vampirovibrionales bacterium]|nr:aminotransferase class I/II-fold pyridoxal phosphate-dependent enzyme [Vampirovibrionales bacterium]